MNIVHNGIVGDTLAEIRIHVEEVLQCFFEEKVRFAIENDLPPEVVSTLHAFVFSAAKRLRPTLCVLGWQAVEGKTTTPANIIQAAAAIELCHTSILIHDDIIDSSDTRRGRPTIHRALAEQHQSRIHAATIGLHGAILLGNITMAWADELMHRALSADPRAGLALQCFDAMRADVNYGQYLDRLTAGSLSTNLDSALTIIRYKTASYTFEGPLRLGATCAGASEEIHSALAAYARPLGVAIQLQNDILDTYGNQSGTVKPSLSDLREGKHTPLLALAIAHASPQQAAQLGRLIGNPDANTSDYDAAQAILNMRARGQVEEMIQTRWRKAQQALDRSPLPQVVRHSLEQIAKTIGLGTVYNKDGADSGSAPEMTSDELIRAGITSSQITPFAARAATQRSS